MKTVFPYCLCLLFFCMLSKAQGQRLHKLNFKTPEAMAAYFQYAPGKKIISGHRGTMEDGMPENAIPALKKVLQHSEAIFEIDPRYTKDSVAIMMHDATLDRTTTGQGRVADYTWKELKKLRLKDHAGKPTGYKINTLDEMIRWAKGKTILNLDKKDLPLAAVAEIIRKHQAYAWVWVTVHSVAEAKFFLDKDPRHFLSLHIRDQKSLMALKAAGLPYSQMIVYIGPEIKAENQALYAFFKSKGVMCMISTASSYDKLKTTEERAQKYNAVFADGASILESDLPIAVSQAIGSNK